MNRRSIFKLLKDWLRPDIHTRVAKAKKHLRELEKLLPSSCAISRTQRDVLDGFFCRVADLMSFGKAPSGGVVAELPRTKTLCFSDFASTSDPFGLLASVVEPLMSWRLDPRYKGREVVALEVVWLNIPHKQNNPFQDIGFFYALAYSEGPMTANSSPEWQELKSFRRKLS
jgi:hypothetical protein